MATVVYALCALTSLACAALLLRGYLANRVRLLLWVGLCFAGLALNNVLLFVDLVLLPTAVDLYVPRLITSVASAAILLYGLIWDAA